MTKKELILALQPFDDDSVIIIISDHDGGWTNTGEVTQKGSSVAIHTDFTLPFTDE